MAKVAKRCECCGAEMAVRAADIKRGWGRYCSKRCKAVAHDRREGGSYRAYAATIHPFSQEAFEE